MPPTHNFRALGRHLPSTGSAMQATAAAVFAAATRPPGCADRLVVRLSGALAEMMRGQENEQQLLYFEDELMRKLTAKTNDSVNDGGGVGGGGGDDVGIGHDDVGVGGGVGGGGLRARRAAAPRRPRPGIVD